MSLMANKNVGSFACVPGPFGEACMGTRIQASSVHLIIISLFPISKALFLYFFQEKIDLDFCPVSTCTPTETLSIHSDITVYNWLQTAHKKDCGCEVRVDGLQFNHEECIKEAAKYAEPSSFRPIAISQSLATSDSVEKSNRKLETSTQSQSTASSPTESVRTIKLEVPTISTQCGMRKTPLGYVLEEDVQTVNHMHTVIANLEKEQTKEDM